MPFQFARSWCLRVLLQSFAINISYFIHRIQKKAFNVVSFGSQKSLTSNGHLVCCTSKFCWWNWKRFIWTFNFLPLSVRELSLFTSSFNISRTQKLHVTKYGEILIHSSLLINVTKRTLVTTAPNWLRCHQLHCLAVKWHNFCRNLTGLQDAVSESAIYWCKFRVSKHGPNMASCTYNTSRTKFNMGFSANHYLSFWMFRYPLRWNRGSYLNGMGVGLISLA